MLTQAWRWFTHQLDEIDAQANALTRPGLPGWHTVTVVIAATVLLGFLAMGVNNLELRRMAADALLTGLDLDAGLGSEALENRRGFMSNLTWAGGCLVGYLLVPALIVRLVFRRRMADFGWTTVGCLRHMRLYGLLFLPVALLVVGMSFDPSFQQTYPFYFEPESLLALLIWELAYGLQFLSLEFFFRGFLLHGLKHRYGHAAIWVMLIPYVMIHFTKPPAEAAGAILAGTVLGVLSLRTGSIFGGVLVHISVAWMMDLLSLWQRGVLGAIW